jgi:TetR/AcrR family transcriptional regulator
MATGEALAGGDTRNLILEQAIGLFADAGYAGVSVRDVAARVGISAPTLYHHFPDKESLYLAAMERAFAHTQREIHAALARDLPAIERLQCFVERFTELAAADANFRKLLQRELLDGDERRLALLAQRIFREPHEAVVALARELSSDLDPYLLTNSVVGLVLFCFQSAPLRRHLPGGRARHDQPKVIAQHVVSIVTRACNPRSEA